MKWFSFICSNNETSTLINWVKAHQVLWCHLAFTWIKVFIVKHDLFSTLVQVMAWCRVKYSGFHKHAFYKCFWESWQIKTSLLRKYQSKYITLEFPHHKRKRIENSGKLITSIISQTFVHCRTGPVCIHMGFVCRPYCKHHAATLISSL